MAAKAKASEMGIGDRGEAGSSNIESGESVESDEMLEGADELLPRIKIFVSNFQILAMMPVRLIATAISIPHATSNHSTMLHYRR